jgi:hypothetical protein
MRSIPSIPLARDDLAVAEATPRASPSCTFIRNAKEPKATLLQHKHAPDPRDCHGFFGKRFLNAIFGDQVIPKPSP